MSHGLITRLGRIYEIPGRGAGGVLPMEGLRAYAALLVFAVHYLDPCIRRVYDIDPNALSLSDVEQPGLMIARYLFASHYGVDIFFILSGYLILRLVARAGFRYGPFLWQRLKRVYPAAFVALAVWALLRIEVQEWYGWVPAQLLGNLLFLNAIPQLGVVPYTTVTWSLFFELVFYATFPLILLLVRKPGRITPVSVLLFGLAFAALGWAIGGSFVRFSMFFAGALLASLRDERLRAMAAAVPVWLVVAAFIASTLLFAETLSYDVFTPVFLLTGAMFVLHVLHGDGRLSRGFSAAPLRWLGNVSYSFYLVHGLGIEIVMYRCHDLFAALPAPLYVTTTLMLSLALSVVFATALFLLVERPYFHRQGARRQPRLGVAEQALG